MTTTSLDKTAQQREEILQRLLDTMSSQELADSLIEAWTEDKSNQIDELYQSLIA